LQEQESKTGFVVKNGQWQRQSEGKDAGEPIELLPQHEDGLDIYGDYFLNGMAKTNGGTVFWLAVQPGNDVPEYKFGPTGIYFYSEETKKYYFLPTGEDKDVGANIASVEFNVDGQFFINNFAPPLALFTFPELKCIVKIEDTSKAFWVDDKRFVFSKPSNSELIMNSVYLFDTLSGEWTTLKEATKTSSFLLGIHEPGYISGRENEVLVVGSENVINVTELFVKSENDLDEFWEKCEAKYLTIEIPARGGAVMTYGK
jgi:hypothetical protein